VAVNGFFKNNRYRKVKGNPLMFSVTGKNMWRKQSVTVHIFQSIRILFAAKILDFFQHVYKAKKCSSHPVARHEPDPRITAISDVIRRAF